MVEYTYTKLGSLQPNTKVNVYGVVKFIKEPYKTRGSDHCTMISIVDQTLSGLNEKLKCLLFARNQSDLPEPNIGDVIRFHRLSIISFNGDLQGQSGPGFSWLIFSSSSDDPEEPDKSSSSQFTFSDDEKKKVEELRRWSRGSTSIERRFCCFQDVDVGQYFDAYCQVVYTSVVEPGVCRLVRVWDGTQFSHPLRSLSCDKETDIQKDDSLCSQSSGFAYDVGVYDNHCTATAHVKPGDFIKIVNLHLVDYKQQENPHAPSIELCLHGGNSFGRCLKVVSPDLDELKEMKDKMEVIALENDSFTISGQPSSSEQRADKPDSPKPGCSNWNDAGEKTGKDSVGAEADDNAKDSVDTEDKRNESGDSENDWLVLSSEVREEEEERKKQMEEEKKKKHEKTQKQREEQEKQKQKEEQEKQKKQMGEQKKQKQKEQEEKSQKRKEQEEKSQKQKEHEKQKQKEQEKQKQKEEQEKQKQKEQEKQKQKEQEKKKEEAKKREEKQKEQSENERSTRSSSRVEIPGRGSSNRGQAGTLMGVVVKGTIRGVPVREQTRTTVGNFVIKGTIRGSSDRVGTSGALVASDKDNGQKGELGASTEKRVLRKRGGTFERSDSGKKVKEENSGVLRASDRDNGQKGELGASTEKRVLRKRGAASERSDSAKKAREVESIEMSDEARCMVRTSTVVINHPNVTRSTIETVLNHSVPYKFRVKTKVVNYHPKPDSVGEFLKLYCPHCQYLCSIPGQADNDLQIGSGTSCDVPHYVCPRCFKQVDSVQGLESPPHVLQYIYMLRFILKDNTGSLVANIWKKEAVTFFQDIQPVEIVKDPTKLADIEEMLAQLCNTSHPAQTEDKPWMECCLRSFSYKNRTNYQIFDTVIV